eukprot:gene7800-7867_t
MSDTAAAEVLTEVDGNVLIVTMNRPEAKNAMNKAAAEGIAAAMDRLDADPDLRCAILTGAGGTVSARRIAVDSGPRIPPRIAMELALTGDFISAQRAYELGFINQISEGPSIDAAKALAARVAENGPLALIASKAIVRDSHEWTEENMWDKQAAYIQPVFTSSDAREGAAAFAEKRKPNWQGK